MRHPWHALNAPQGAAAPTLETTALEIWCQLCCFSLQRVLGLTSLDGVLNPTHVNGKHIVHNVFSVNKTGIVILENKAGTMHRFKIERTIVLLQLTITLWLTYLLLHFQRTCRIGWYRQWNASPIVCIHFLLTLKIQNITICFGTSTWRTQVKSLKWLMKTPVCKVKLHFIYH